MERFLYGRWLDILMIIFAAYAWVSTPILLGRSAGIEKPIHELALGLIGAISFILIILFSIRLKFIETIQKNIRNFEIPSLTVILTFGITIRILWILTFPATPTSDGASYLHLAQHLLAEGRYETAGTKAYWPPGYPFFLMPWLALFPKSIAVPLSQIFLYIFATIGCYKLATYFSGNQAGRLAALLISIWPNIISLSTTPEKEMLILALLPWIVFGLFAESLKTKIIAGIGLGFAILVQPSLQLLLPAAFLCPFLLKQPNSLKNSCFLLLGALIIIAPWSIRNFETFEKFVLVSSNGGDNLYRANNPLATGGYTEHGAIDLSNYGEVEKDKIAKKLAIDWITENPFDFLKLAVEKQIRFMGDDGYGAYSTLKRGAASNSTATYTAAKLTANIWWLIAWASIAILAMSKGLLKQHRFVVFLWLYLFGLHSVFESNGKYHAPMIWVLCVWTACSLINLKEKTNR